MIDAAMTVLLVQCFMLMGAILAAHGIARSVAIWSIGAGERWGVVSHVDQRSSHTRPTSRLGGVGLVLGFTIPSLALVLVSWLMPRSDVSWGGNAWLMFTIFASALAIFCVGLADDVWNLSAPVKLALQLLALVPLSASGLRFLSLDGINPPGLFPAWVPTLAAMGWLLFFLNAFNFMDGMDGFATRFAMHVCLWLFPIALLKAVAMGRITDLRLELMLVAIVSAACSGFYLVNRPPARVFMGDGGSLTLGFFLALLFVLADGGYFVAHYRTPANFNAAVPAGAVFLLLWPFVFDVVLTIVRRARRGENLFAAHRSHLYQRLMIAGMSHADVLRLNIKYFRICGVLAVVYAFVTLAWVRWILLVAAVAALAHYWRFVLTRELSAKVRGEGAAEGRE